MSGFLFRVVFMVVAVDIRVVAVDVRVVFRVVTVDMMWCLCS